MCDEEWKVEEEKQGIKKVRKKTDLLGTLTIKNKNSMQSDRTD